MKNAELDPEVVECDACRTIPLSHLSLDVAEPVAGWPAFFAERGVEVVEDDLGRPSVPRRVLGELLAEDREREALVAAQRAELARAREVPIPRGVPALPDGSPFESMAASDGFTTASEEFGGGRTPAYQEFLDERLNEGRRQAAEQRAEAELLEKAQRVLDGRAD